MNQHSSRVERGEQSRPLPPGMVRVPGGTFRMGSDSHYPEEAPVHRVEVDGFLMDRTPVTNRQFAAFVRATGHVTVAEKVPDAADYPGALPEMLYAGSLVFRKSSGPVDLTDWSRWWDLGTTGSLRSHVPMVSMISGHGSRKWLRNGDGSGDFEISRFSAS